MSQIIRAEKLNGKNGVICLFSMFLSRVIVLKLSKKVHFLQYCTEIRKKSKYITAIYMYAFKLDHCASVLMVLFIMLWFTVLEILGFEVKEIC